MDKKVPTALFKNIKYRQHIEIVNKSFSNNSNCSILKLIKWTKNTKP